MATVKDVLDRKGPRVICTSKEASVLEAARLMNEHKIGGLVVTEQDRVIGIFTERDVLSRVVAEHRDSVTTRVEEVMTREIVCCRPETDLEEARGVFKNRRIRHLPVVDAGQKLLGLVSIGDLNAYHAYAQESTIHLLHEYIYGRS